MDVLDRALVDHLSLEDLLETYREGGEEMLNHPVVLRRLIERFDLSKSIRFIKTFPQLVAYYECPTGAPL